MYDISLQRFYADKAKEPGGGHFFAVTSRAMRLGTYWGRSAWELRRHLNSKLPQGVVSDGFQITPLV